jgi:hypothetical protein
MGKQQGWQAFEGFPKIMAGYHYCPVKMSGNLLKVTTGAEIRNI